MTVLKMALTGVFAAAILILLGSNASAQEAAPEFTRVVSCTVGNGRIDTTFVNDTDEPVTWRVEYEGLSIREVTAPAGDLARISLTGRRDGDADIVTSRDGEVISTETITVACDDEPATAGPEVTPIVVCRQGNGFVMFQFVNNTATPKPYVIAFDGVSNRSTTAAAYGAAVRGTSGRPDGVYNAVVTSAGLHVTTVQVTVACDAPPVRSVPTSVRYDWAGVLPAGTGYEAYVQLTDDTDTITALFPESMTYVDTAVGISGGQEISRIDVAFEEGPSLEDPFIFVRVIAGAAADELAILSADMEAGMYNCISLTSQIGLTQPEIFGDEILFFADPIDLGDVSGHLAVFDGCSFGRQNTHLIGVSLITTDGDLAIVLVGAPTTAELSLVDEILRTINF